MRALAVSLMSAGLVAALLATPASSRPAAGSINITVNPVEAAYAYDTGLGPVYFLTTSASWSLEATRTEGAITIKYPTEGGDDDHLGFGSAGRGVHSSELHTGFLATYAGHRYLLRAKWRV